MAKRRSTLQAVCGGFNGSLLFPAQPWCKSPPLRLRLAAHDSASCWRRIQRVSHPSHAAMLEVSSAQNQSLDDRERPQQSEGLNDHAEGAASFSQPHSCRAIRLALEFLAPIAALLVELGAWVRFPAAASCVTWMYHTLLPRTLYLHLEHCDHSGAEGASSVGRHGVNDIVVAVELGAGEPAVTGHLELCRVMRQLSYSLHQCARHLGQCGPLVSVRRIIQWCRCGYPNDPRSVCHPPSSDPWTSGRESGNNSGPSLPRRTGQGTWVWTTHPRPELALVVTPPEWLV